MQRPLLPEMAEQWQKTLGWQPSLAQQEAFQLLYEVILEGNRQLNLTRIVEPEEFWEKHLWDSLNGVRGFLRAIEPASQTGSGTHQAMFKVIDIGTGGGFPGIPVAIARPDWSVTLLDSTRKKIAFLDMVIRAIEIPNAKTWVDRAEQAAHLPQHREIYDLALIRAVASPSVCAEYALPFLKLGGEAILYRGQWTAAEATELEKAVAQLGGCMETVSDTLTPLSQSIRNCVHLRKIKSTHAQFPRAVGVPAQNPL